MMNIAIIIPSAVAKSSAVYAATRAAFGRPAPNSFDTLMLRKKTKV